VIVKERNEDSVESREMKRYTSPLITSPVIGIARNSPIISPREVQYGARFGVGYFVSVTGLNRHCKAKGVVVR
jgi:hypothetical protein